MSGPSYGDRLGTPVNPQPANAAPLPSVVGAVAALVRVSPIGSNLAFRVPSLVQPIVVQRGTSALLEVKLVDDANNAPVSNAALFVTVRTDDRTPAQNTDGTYAALIPVPMSATPGLYSIRLAASLTSTNTTPVLEFLVQYGTDHQRSFYQQLTVTANA